MEKYNPQKIEKKWQKHWEKQGVFAAKDADTRPKFYALVEFPYPSGEGLHVGHPRSYTAMDIIARKRRMEGYNVLYPIGFDSFGLPTENYAIKTGRPPSEITKENIANFTRQLKSVGFSFDWDRAVTTSDPAYYKWTQWIFLQLFKHGLAYKKKQAINWCPSCKIGLANEEVVEGKCERCGTSVEKREKEQWMLAITKYADKLLEGLKDVDYIERAKVQQENWIGRSEGLIFTAPVKNMDLRIETFSAHFESCYADTFVVIAPDHPLLPQLLDGTTNQDEVMKFCRQILEKRSRRGTEDEKEPEGIFTGRYIVDPLGNGDLPIWVASFALADYGTGIVKCSANDPRDFAFAKKYGIRLKPILFPKDQEQAKRVRELEECYTDMKEGYLTEPAEFAGRRAGDVRQEIIEYLSKKGFARPITQYKLRDWVFSRQRYWGEPIPLVYCEACANRKQKVLLIHGFGGSGEKNWLPWLKQDLEKRGFEVFNPTMTNSAHPTVESWMKELKPYIEKMGEDDVIVGHSLGSKAALHLIETTNKKIGHLYLIASAIGEMHDRDWDLYRREWKGADVDALKKFWETPLSFAKISELTGNIRVILSDDDPWIKRKTHESLPRSWQFELWKGFGHFTANQIPELMEIVLQAKNSGWIPLPEKELPLELPKVEKYQPTDTGESPLASIEKWVKTKCPKCGSTARRETDTMPNWAGSSWYFLRYCDPENKKEFASMEKLRYWIGPVRSSRASGPGGTRDSVASATSNGMGGVDWYNGGMEHTVLHLLYSRFWNQFLYDIGVVPTREPYKKRTSHGLILAEDGEKMSKSRGNVVNPDEIIKQYGADTLRLYEMFMGPFDQAVPWSTASIAGIQRFLERVWILQGKLTPKTSSRAQRSEVEGSHALPSARGEISRYARNDEAVERLLHKTIKKVTEDIEQMKFNTAIAAMMTLVNALSSESIVRSSEYEALLKLLNPFAPHITEELWEKIGKKGLLAQQPWPKYDPALVKDEEIELVIQVNGRVRDRIKAPADITKEEAEATALQSERVKTWLAGKQVQSVVFVPGKLINIVTSS